MASRVPATSFLRLQVLFFAFFFHPSPILIFVHAKVVFPRTGTTFCPDETELSECTFNEIKRTFDRLAESTFSCRREDVPRCIRFFISALRRKRRLRTLDCNTSTLILVVLTYFALYCWCAGCWNSFGNSLLFSCLLFSLTFMVLCLECPEATRWEIYKC